MKLPNLHFLLLLGNFMLRLINDDHGQLSKVHTAECTMTLTWKSNILSRHRFIERRILYYSNSSSTLQNALLQCGDIDLNIGPDGAPTTIPVKNSSVETY